MDLEVLSSYNTGGHFCNPRMDKHRLVQAPPFKNIKGEKILVSVLEEGDLEMKEREEKVGSKLDLSLARISAIHTAYTRTTARLPALLFRAKSTESVGVLGANESREKAAFSFFLRSTIYLQLLSDWLC